MISYDNLWNILKEKGNSLELREDDFENVGVHRHSSGAVGAIPHTERYPHFIDETIEGVNRSGRG